MLEKLNVRSVGRRVTLKYFIFGFLGVCLIAIIILLYLLFIENNPIIIGGSSTLIKENAALLLTQFVVILLTIYLWGGFAGTAIVISGRSPFWISFGSIIGTWITMILCSGLAVGFQKSIASGFSGFQSGLMSSIFHGLPIFLLLGSIHALICSYWMGREIKRKGQVSKHE